MVSSQINRCKHDFFYLLITNKIIINKKCSIISIDILKIKWTSIFIKWFFIAVLLKALFKFWINMMGNMSPVSNEKSKPSIWIIMDKG